MASPGLESFCCVFHESHTQPSKHEIEVRDRAILAYNILCIIFSSISICGAIYQLVPKTPAALPRARRELESFIRQNTLVCWLAFADLLASFGICLRSSLWLSGIIPFSRVQSSGSPDFAHYFCAASLGWIQYFYIATYFWTFCYALDVYLMTKNIKSLMWAYHVISWVLSLLICAAGLISLYYPSLLRCDHQFGRLVPHYLSSYIPILLVMFSAPILYIKSTKAVRLALMESGRYTDQERRIVCRVTEKFLLVTLAFYICWLPNILNGLLLLVNNTSPVSPAVFMALWQFMAVVNPVQAFLNTLVYRGAAGCNSSLQLPAQSRRTSSHPDRFTPIQGSYSDSNETSPLLRK